MRLTESPTTFPMEYSEALGRIYGALAYDLSSDSMFMLSARNMPVGCSLNARIFFANEYELDSIAVTAYILSKELVMADGWRGYKYGLDFAEISKVDRRKLEELLNNHSNPQQILRRENSLATESFFTKPSVLPSTNLNLTSDSAFTCRLYENGKCLNTRAFCDLCQNVEDDTILAQRARAIQESRSHRFGPFRPELV